MTLLRAIALLGPATLAIALGLARRDARAFAGAAVAFLWVFALVVPFNAVAAHLDLWKFGGEGGVVLGVPLDVAVGWALLWGVVPALVRAPLPVVVAGAVALDLVAMPAGEPLLLLGKFWLLGEGAAVLVLLVPAQLLARWTVSESRLEARATLLVVVYAGLVLVLLPVGVAGLEAVKGIGPIAAQLLVVPALLGLSAMHEFASRGRGTPLPFDPPRRLVTSGLYSYVRNPMQVATVVLLAGLGAATMSGPLVLVAGAALAFFVGMAAWDEQGDLASRHGKPWLRYREAVRSWLPRWRPFHRSLHPAFVELAPPPARLYVAEQCLACSQLRGWLLARSPAGLEIVAAEDHPTTALARLTYDARDGSPPEQGVHALGRALEHLNLAWAVLGCVVRLPGIGFVVQLVADASGAGPKLVERKQQANPSE